MQFWARIIEFPVVASALHAIPKAQVLNIPMIQFIGHGKVKMTERETLLNAFRPGTAITLPAQFAGRKDEITTLVDALYVDGTCPIIYGDRGLGKSSLALQIERIALGDAELLDELGLSDRALPPESCFTTFEFSCTDAITTKDELLQRLINTAEGFTDTESLPGKVLKSSKRTTTVKLKFYEHQVAETYKQSSGLGKFKRLSTEEKFELTTRQIVEGKDTRVLYIIDELDRVRDTRGLASVIKKMSSRGVAFLLVGVAQNVSAILHDHASLERALIQVPVRPMRDDDSAMIVRKAESFLHQNGLKFEFPNGTTSKIVRAAGGFPWFVHTFGLAALRRAYDERRRVVTESDVDNAISSLGRRQFAQQFYDTYQMAVGESSQREVVLRLFAKWRDLDIPTSEIYPLAEQLGIKNASVLTKHLTMQRYGRVLVRPPYAPAGVFRFANAMFKHYINLRLSVYRGVQEEVEEVWKKSTE